MKRKKTTTDPQSFRSPFLRNVLQQDAPAHGGHPFDVLPLQNLDLTFTTAVSFFVGENGSGKSTLLEAIAEKCGFSAEGGSHDHNPFRDAPGAENYASSLRLSWRPKVFDGFFMRAESFYNLATYLDEVTSLSRYGGRPLHAQSHGESFLALFSNRFEHGIYILDEPEAALSPKRQLAFLRILRQLEDTRRAQFLIATHSPILLSYPGATVFSLDEPHITTVDYRETEHFTLTRDFLNTPERFHRYLFDDSEESE